MYIYVHILHKYMFSDIFIHRFRFMDYDLGAQFLADGAWPVARVLWSFRAGRRQDKGGKFKFEASSTKVSPPAQVWRYWAPSAPAILTRFAVAYALSPNISGRFYIVLQVNGPCTGRVTITLNGL